MSFREWPQLRAECVEIKKKSRSKLRAKTLTERERRLLLETIQLCNNAIRLCDENTELGKILNNY